jgi:hypothetical protein
MLNTDNKVTAMPNFITVVYGWNILTAAEQDVSRT